MRNFDPDLGYVYCVLASSGAVKVGMSTKPVARIRDIRNMAKLAMLTIDDFCISREVIRPLLVEQEILSKVGKSATLIFGSEWFSGADYSEVKVMVNSVYSNKQQVKNYFREKQVLMDRLWQERMLKKSIPAR